jgi:prepilin-type N-terminal cleavage/methylation domain-containing protein
MPHVPVSPTAKSRHKKPRFRPGFSMIELLVVIAIIAVLLAILFTIVHAAIQAVRAFKSG